jgi:DNA ligase-1
MCFKNINFQLDWLQELVDNIRITSSTKEKYNILKQSYNTNSKLFTLFMKYTYDFSKTYGISKSNFIKLYSKIDKLNTNLIVDDIFWLLDQLNNRDITGYEAISYIKTIYDNISNKDMMFLIFEKDLKAGINVSTINKVNNCVEEFNVPLANNYKDYSNKIDLRDYLISRKLDGARCIVFGKTGECFSRQGKQYKTLQVITNEIIDLNTNYIFDGEICLIDEQGNDNFQGIMSEIMRKNHTINNPQYIIFDCWTEDEFKNKKSELSHKERLNRIPKINTNNIKILDHIEAFDNLDKFMDMVRINKWEGAILRHKYNLDFNRGKNLLKIKDMNDEEFKIIDIEEGGITNLTENGKTIINIPCIKGIIIKINDNDFVSVGSGFTPKQRIYYLNHKSELIGKIATIQFFERTIDKNGKHSLRFPIYKGIREII